MNCPTRHRSRTSLDISVMDALVKFADGHEACSPSLLELSQQTGFCRRSIHRAIKLLILRHMVVVSQRFADDGSRLSNAYHLACPNVNHPQTKKADDYLRDALLYGRKREGA